jgi:hypothetical protein
MTRSQMWVVAASRALTGARDGGAVMWGLILESTAFVSALHHLRKCAEMAGRHAKDPRVPQHIVVALQRFDAVVPGLVEIRNALEHYDDEYVLGLGDLQQTGVKRAHRLPDEALAQEWRVVPDFLDPPECLHPILTVGPHTIDLVTALAAARQLRDDLYTAARAEAGDI